jgi:hypothetical protein
MIQPTVGRLVLYFSKRGAEPHAAIITKVWGTRCINLAIFNEAGTPYNNTSVTLLQDDDEVPEYGHAQWMPYQKGQAAKAEALQSQLDQASASTPQGIIPPHIQRVLQEKAELDARHAKLGEFMLTPIFRGLPANEQHRMQRQFDVMAEYSTILSARIAASGANHA